MCPPWDISDSFLILLEDADISEHEQRILEELLEREGEGGLGLFSRVKHLLREGQGHVRELRVESAPLEHRQSFLSTGFYTPRSQRNRQHLFIKKRSRFILPCLSSLYINCNDSLTLTEK